MHFHASSQIGIDLDKYEIKNQIDRGAFGTVYMVTEKSTSKIYAAKVIFCRDEEEHKRVADSELEVMLLTKHPTLIEFIGYSFIDFNKQHNYTIIMQLAANGSLSSFIDKIRNKEITYTNTQLQIILIGVARAMKYLHDRNFIHRDLKPGNVLLDEHFYPLVTDFGYTKYFETGKSVSQRETVGTLPYMAPELLRNKPHNRKVDVYSFGILMFEILTQDIPYKEYDPIDIIIKVTTNNLRPTSKKEIKDSLRNLMYDCLLDNYNDRPTFTEIFKKLSYDNNYLLDDVNEIELKKYVESITLINDPIEELNYKLESANILKDQLSEENEQLKKENEQLQLFKSKESEQLQLVKSSNEKLIKEIEQLKTENTILKSENKKLIECNNKLKELNNQISDEQKLLKDENDSLIKDKICLTDENTKLTKINEGLKRK